MPLTGEKYTQLNQPEATTDGADHGRWVACDESGWDGEQLVGRQRRFLVYASVAVDDVEAAALIQTLRDQAGIRQAKELKFDLFKNRANRWSLLQQMWEPGGALDDRCSVYVVDKEYAAAAKVIDLLLEEKEHDEGGNLYADGKARALARTLALEGPRALRGTLFQELMSAFVALASRRGTSRQDEALGGFVAALDQAWAASTRKAVTALLARCAGPATMPPPSMRTRPTRYFRSWRCSSPQLPRRHAGGTAASAVSVSSPMNSRCSPTTLCGPCASTPALLSA
ncbi:hypothetical protein AB0L39_27050 [Streptomyces parvus]|uniref:hypothetical protein n=1 Tax=Streptomyces parvus TaxID=66428 RepID=UPI003431EA86